jgi:hypothetical protein
MRSGAEFRLCGTADASRRGSMHTTSRRFLVAEVELLAQVSYASFTRAFTSLLGRMDPTVLGGLRRLPAEAARAKLASFVGPLDFALFQEIDHGAILAGLYGREAGATTYVFGNALIAVEMTKHDTRAGLHVPLRLFVQELDETSRDDVIA